MNKIIEVIELEARPVAETVTITIELDYLNDFQQCENREQVERKFYSFLHEYCSDYVDYYYNEEELKIVVDLVCDKLVDQFARYAKENEDVEKTKEDKKLKAKLKREKQYLKLKEEFEGK